ncbi:acetolactate synthase-1/3 small subunit [Caloramator quimbayensis]|uniref:Acetolactate synthase-1/3 small subunit n=1 Tax=Caloramator quimbayensis TaxID=1147123 RepID=A0A1T4XE17_9CLOT|nr:hypothetical protein [Caloramator quimbayensis]SKA87802.1 acetolactate synthase-1/3 small subunit [Caloramator quimbayensis]
MSKTFYVSLIPSIDPFLRIVSALRKKGFDIESVNFKELDSQRGSLTITINENMNLGLYEAMLQVKKVVGVYEIKELEEEC